MSENSSADEPGTPVGGAGLVRLRLGLRYDGAGFSGWAAQPGRRTVEGELVAALQRVLRADVLRVVVAGRTDAGVHARGQVVHVDVPEAGWLAAPGRSTRSPADAVLRRLAGVLPPDVVVAEVALAAAGFDARFSALWRRYAYRVVDGPVDPLRRGHVLAVDHRLDVTAMHAAAQALVGEHDFLPFCRPREGGTTIRTLQRLDWTRDGDELVATVVADAFCHHMVRALVGTGLEVGRGRRPVSWPARLLAAGVRDDAVPLVPAHGLVLEEVGYPPDAELAARALVTRAVRVPPPHPR